MIEIRGIAPPNGDMSSRLRFKVAIKIHSPSPPFGWTANITYHPDSNYTLSPPEDLNIGYDEGKNFYKTQQDLLAELIYLYGLTPS